MKVLGIDLAALEKNPTGVCLLNKITKTVLVHTDEEILKIVKDFDPEVIAIDAPFSFPRKGWWRDSDKRLLKMGFKLLSPKFKSMMPLVRRAKKLKKMLGNYDIIEVFPRATEKILKIKRSLKFKNKHVYDAWLCALTAKAYLCGKYEAVGKQRIIIPTKVL